MKKLFYILPLIFTLSVSAQETVGFPNGIPMEDGAIPVAIQDQHTEIIDLHLTRYIDDIAITQNTSLDDTSVQITCDTLPVAGNSVCFKENYAFYQGEILSVTPDGGNAYTIVLDAPLDYPYTTNGGCSLVDQNINVDGSVTPVIFSVSPEGLNSQSGYQYPQEWDITRMMIFIADATAMDDARFGGIVGGLTNGIMVRSKNGITKNVFNAKSNGDMALHSYDVTYVPNTLGPAGLYGLRVRRSFNGFDKNGVTMRLSSENEDQVQLIVRDDLTDLDSMYAVVQGHVVKSGTLFNSASVPITGNTWVKVIDSGMFGKISLVGDFYKQTKGYYIVKPEDSIAPTLPPYNPNSKAVPITTNNININYPYSVDVYIWSDYIDIYAVVSKL